MKANLESVILHVSNIVIKMLIQAMEDSLCNGNRFRRIPRQLWAASSELDPVVCAFLLYLCIIPFFY